MELHIPVKIHVKRLMSQCFLIALKELMEIIASVCKCHFSETWWLQQNISLWMTNGEQPWHVWIEIFLFETEVCPVFNWIPWPQIFKWYITNNSSENHFPVNKYWYLLKWLTQMIHLGICAEAAKVLLKFPLHFHVCGLKNNSEPSYVLKVLFTFLWIKLLYTSYCKH